MRAAVRPVSQVLADLRTRLDGLSSEDAADRLRREGPNALPRPKSPGAARRLLAQMIHFFALMLWVAAAFAFVAAMPQLGVAIIVVVVVNGVFSFAQEERAQRATEALARLIPETATVIRDGRKHRAPAEELVPGDVVLLREGDRISADGRVIRSDGLRVDNSTLTGESRPSSREVRPAAEPIVDPTEADDVVFAGTYVTSGSGLAAVVATGGQTRLGAISRLTGEVVRRPTPIHIELNRAVRVIAAFALSSGLVFFGVAVLLGMDPKDGFLFAIGVIVALVPEGLLPTLTLSLAMSATRMAHRGALVRHLESVETLGSTTVICSDKTGTMTTNQMTARALAVPGHRYRATGAGFDPTGAIFADGRPASPRELAALEPILRIASLCGDARVERPDGRWRCVGDPTEGALMVLADKAGVEREEWDRRTPRVREFPFESERRRMSTVHALPSGAHEVLVKGSPEAVLAACRWMELVGGRRIQLDAAAAAGIMSDLQDMAENGLRVLGFAHRMVDDIPPTVTEAESDLTFLGLVGMEDPVRAEVPDAIDKCQQAGIRVVMVTGDHPATAVTVAGKAGLPDGRVVLGAELPDDDEALADLLTDPALNVLARVMPEQKLRIAQALQSRGHVVAMTGDGVNDAPALRRADIGVAMGVAGTDVAREASDLVLLDDNFAHIVQAVEEGRAAFDNIRRFLTYHLTDNVAELAPFAVWALSAGRIPLMISVLQVLALDIGTDLLPALALGAERPAFGTMARPPRARKTRLLDRRVLGRAFGFLGPVEAVVSMSMLPLGAALFFGWPGMPLAGKGSQELSTLSTMVFAAIVLMQMANAFELRSTPESLFQIGPLSNRLLVGAVAMEALTLLVFVYVPGVRHLLGQRGLGLAEWGVAAVSPWILLAAEEARKAIVRARSGLAGP